MACAISELLGELEGILLKLPDSYNTSSLQSYSFGKSCIATDKAFFFQLKSTDIFLINFSMKTYVVVLIRSILLMHF